MNFQNDKIDTAEDEDFPKCNRAYFHYKKSAVLILWAVAAPGRPKPSSCKQCNFVKKFSVQNYCYLMYNTHCYIKIVYYDEFLNCSIQLRSHCIRSPW